jgi:hypothetical protein
MTTRRLAAILLIVTAVLFTLGVSAEPGGEQHEAQPVAEHVETTHEDSHRERVLGVDVESTLTVTGAVVLSVVLAVALWLSRRRWLAAVAAGFAVLFAAFDGGELVHQIGERRTGLVVLAAVLVAGHLTASVLAGRSSRRLPR